MRISPLGFVPVGLAILAGCSDPVPPTPRGAFLVSFVDTGLDCQHAGHNTEVGQIGPDTKDAVIVDGTEDTDVGCTVRAKGSAFDVSADISQKDKSLNLVVNGITAAASEAAPANGGLSYVSATTVDSYVTSSETPCSFYFIPSKQGIAAGRVWFSFTCPKIEAEGSVCSIKQGYAIFENCTE